MYRLVQYTDFHSLVSCLIHSTNTSNKVGALAYTALIAARHWQEELAYSIELIGSTVKCRNELWLDKHLYVCSRQLSGGWKNYQKKHPEWQRKINSKKSGCHCQIVIKRYHHTPTILGRYEVEHNHKVGLANLAYTRMSRMAWEQIKSMLQLKMDRRKIVCK